MAITSSSKLPPDEVACRERPGQLALRYSWSLALYVGLTLLFTWPLPLHLSETVIRVQSGDAWQNLWNIWWVPHALFDLHSNPFHTTLLYYPDSPTLYLHALNPLAGIISYPLQNLFGLVTAFNLLVILMLTLSAFCAYLLGRYLKLSQPAALLAGAIFAYSPIISSQLDQGQLEQISALWLPLYLLFFLKALEGQTFRGTFWLNSIGAALCFFLTALTTWYYALNLVLVSVFAALWFMLKALRLSRARLAPLSFRLAGVALLCALFIAPLFYPTFKEAANTTYAVVGKSSVLYNSADILHFFWPGNSALWFTQAEPNYDFQWFLGFIPLTLALVAALTNWRRTNFWVALGLFFIILALGPVLKVGLESYTPIKWLPTSWLQKLPFGSIIRVPLRFVTFAMLCLGITAGFGLDDLLKKIRLKLSASKTKLYPTLLPHACAVLTIGLVLLEFYPGPRTLVELKPPNFLSQLKNSPTGAVLEIPLLKIQPLAMYEQTLHHQPIVGGYLARKPTFDFMDYTPGVRELVQTSISPDYKEFSSNDLATAGLPLLNLYNVRYIILHHDWMTPKEENRIKDLFLQLFGKNLEPLATDGPIGLYLVPTYQGGLVNAAGTATKGWHKLEGPPEDLYRWSAGEGEFALYNPNKEPLRFRLDLSLYSYPESRTIEFRLNGQLIGQKALVTAVLPQSLEFTLPPGRSTLNLKASGEAIRPIDRHEGDDERKLSFGVKELKLSMITDSPK